MKTIWQLELHETLSIPSVDGEYPRLWDITRVASGWIYQSVFTGNPIFVPYITDPNSQA